jgi:hypothetical protein
MKRTVMIKENTEISGSGITIHIIEMKDDNPRGGSYRQLSASEGMIERSGIRWYNHWYIKNGKTHLSKVKYDRWRNNDEELRLEQHKRYEELMGVDNALIHFPKIKKLSHHSVWDFFDYIGYSYKDKKTSNTDTLIMIKEK